MKYKKQERDPFKDQYPQLDCYWTIHIGDIQLSATEVTGLKETIELIPYRSGNMTNDFATIKMNRPQDGRIVIKWPIFSEGSNGAHIFQDWRDRDRDGLFNQASAVDVTVILMDENQEPVMQWLCKDCNPIDYAGPDLRGDKGEIAIQTMTLATNSIKSSYVH